ncbi:hypothetical protein Tco_1168623 [Tanacetum coccineum]
MNEYGNDRMSKKAPTVNEQAASDKFDDPFGVYKTLKRNNDKVASESVDPQFPPGITSVVAEVNVTKDADPNQVSHPKIDVTNNNKDVSCATSGYNCVSKLKSRGSLLDVMDELINAGQTMGYNIEGCMHNIEAIIGSQGDGKETKIETMDLFSIKALWGNLSFDYVFSQSVGFSGGVVKLAELPFVLPEIIWEWLWRTPGDWTFSLISCLDAACCCRYGDPLKLLLYYAIWH